MKTAACLVLSGLLLGATFGDTAELGKVVPDLKLKTVDGKSEISLSDYRTSEEKEGKIVVVHFWSYKCPSGKRCLPALGDFVKFCKDKEVEFVGICSYGESSKELEEYRKANKIDYTLVQDEKLKGAKLFDAKVVTVSYIIGKDGTLLYKGAFKTKESSPLKDALEEVLAGKEVTKSETTARG